MTKITLLLITALMSFKTYAGPAVIWGSPFPLDLGSGLRFNQTDTATTCNSAVAGSIRWNGSNIQICNGSSWGSIGTGSGTVTSVIGGTGLTGGTITSAGTLSLDVTSATGAFINGGNSFGAIATLGTSDNFSLLLKTNNSAQVFVSSAGNVGIGTTTPDTNAKLSISLNTAAPITASTNTVLVHAVGADSANSATLLDAFGTGVSPTIAGRLARGTDASPSAVQNGDIIARFGGRGYGATAFSNIATGGMLTVAGETWTDSAWSTQLQWFTTLTGTITPVVQMVLSQGGRLTLGSTSAQPGGISLKSAVTASSGSAWGININETLTAAANNDALIGLNVNETFADGGFTGVGHYGIIVASGNVGLGTTSPGAQLEHTGHYRIDGATNGYVDFAATAATTTYSLIWPSAQSSGTRVLQNDGSGNLSWASDGGGTVTSVVAGTGLVANTITSVGTLAVDVGTIASKIVQLTAAAQLPTVDGFLLTNLNAASLKGAAVTVAQGGTGLATLTANNVILGNGTSTPSFVAPGTSGNVLTSNGTTWTSAAASGGTATVTNMQVFTASGTFTVPAGAGTGTKFKFTVIGGGGGGGAFTSASNSGGGGGSGATAMYVAAGQAGSSTVAVTIGAGGARGTGSGANGTAGGSSTIVFNSVTVTGGGGGAGLANANPGAGGTATNGTLNARGGDGSNGDVTVTQSYGGHGGGSFMGGGSTDYGVARPYGVGGGGGSTGNGVAGMDGVVIVEWVL